MRSASRPPVRPPPVERQPPHVPQPLQLLPDLGPDIVVARIDSRQPRLEPIDLGQGELRPSPFVILRQAQRDRGTQRRRSEAKAKCLSETVCDRFALPRAAGSPGLRREGAACRRMTKDQVRALS